ncbi:hypothetical protein [Thiohalophilus sp.]|uniref:hypothetical protein n=1 Tax=Thiohalophilus sp. TaxID=3028392 RepID=UPI002ACE5577|nr:hypothetical protein [Thiohalophilus sp.]MDZ7802359.1 hypothetical protein [Thiohalophilus sp.]
MEGIAEEDLDGNVVWIEDCARPLIGFMDDADMEQLRTWSRNSNPAESGGVWKPGLYLLG